MLDAVSVVGSVLIGAITIAVAWLLLIKAYRLLSWIWTALPALILSFETDRLDKALAVLTSLAIFQNIVMFAWTTLENLLGLIPRFIRALGEIRIPPSCDTDLSACAGDFLLRLNLLIGRMVSDLFAVLNLSEFPIVAFILFLLISIFLTPVYGFLRSSIQAGKVSSWLSRAAGYLPSSVQQRLIFTALVIFSFYLALSALLAIAVFQDKSRPQQLTLAAFEKSLEPNVLSQDVFDKAYPQELAVLREPQRPAVTGPDSHVKYSLRAFDIEFQTRLSSSNSLQNDWLGLRQKALADQTRLRDQAKYAFSAGSEASIGKRQTAQHFNELLSWHQQSMQLIRDGMDRCRTVIIAFTTTASQSLDNFRSDLERSKPENVQEIANDFTSTNRRVVLQNFNDARRGCQRAPDDRRPAIPERRSLASGLGLIGDWTGWLVNPEQLPVVIIVGLVGFSLLGATVSRVVRAQERQQRAGLTFDDLLTVVTGGTTAALVVFLGAYGGLALLGTTSGDPNPYVVFITCLIGAVYSEDVWNWARKRILDKNLRSRRRSGGPNRDRRRSKVGT